MFYIAYQATVYYIVFIKCNDCYVGIRLVLKYQWIMNDLLLKIAEIKIGTYALGPGYRAGIWVQGCPFHCKGCIAPEWIGPGGQEFLVDDIVDRILSDDQLEGITLSGGEPMQQALSLANLIKKVRQNRPEINVICFTGYRYQDLAKKENKNGILELISQLDLLIDGPYVQQKNDNIGLRGSSNQSFYYFSDRLRNHGLEIQPRKVEINLNDGNAFIVGIPPKNFSLAWENALTPLLKEMQI